MIPDYRGDNQTKAENNHVMVIKLSEIAAQEVGNFSTHRNMAKEAYTRYPICET